MDFCDMVVYQISRVYDDGRRFSNNVKNDPYQAHEKIRSRIKANPLRNKFKTLIRESLKGFFNPDKPRITGYKKCLIIFSLMCLMMSDFR